MQAKPKLIALCLIAVVSWGVSSPTVFAQNDPPKPTAKTVNPLQGRDTLELEHERIEGLPADVTINRKDIQMPVPDLSFPNQKIETTPAEIIHTPPVETLKVEAAHLPKPKWEKLYGNYVKAGIGRFLTPMLKVYLNNRRNAKWDYGAELSHLSSTGHVKNAGFGDNQLKLKTTYFTNSHAYSGKIYFQHYGYQTYGDSAYYKTEAPEVETIRQRMVRFQVDAALAHHYVPQKLNYNLGLNMQVYSDRRGNSEFHANLLPAFSFNPLDSLTVGLSGQLTAAGISWRATNYSQFFIDLSPVATYRLGIVRLQGGFRLNNYSAGDSSSLGLYPIAKVELNLLENMVVPFVGIEGRTHYNQRFHLMLQNPYIDPRAKVRETKENLFIYGGIGGALEQLTYKAQVHYRSMQNALVYFSAPEDGVYYGDTVRQGYFQLLYEPNYKEYGISLQASYHFDNKYRFGGKIDYSAFSLQRLEYNFHIPNFKAALNGAVTFAKKFTVNVDLNCIGGRTLGFELNGRNAEAGLFFDANLGLEYAFNKRFGIFVEFNNLFNQNYYRWNYYIERPLDFRIGASFGF